MGGTGRPTSAADMIGNTGKLAGRTLFITGASRGIGLNIALKAARDGANALWPQTAIITAAMEMLGGKEVDKQCRKPEIMSDAAYVMLCKNPKEYTGNFAVDEDGLRAEGITDFDVYAVEPGHTLMPDFFLDSFDDFAASQVAQSNKPRFVDGKDTHVSGAPKASPTAADTGKIAGVFKEIEAVLGEEIVQKTKAVYEFEVTGEEPGKWFLDLKNGSGASGKGDSPTPVDVKFTMKSEDFFKMFSGSLKPTTAFMMGKMKLSGDMGKAMKLEKLMGKMKSKL